MKINLKYILVKPKYLYFLIIFTSFSFISKAQETGFPIIRNYTPKEYNNAPQVFSAIQDSRGIMYFSVGDGVMEYDGVSWRSIPNDKQTFVYGLAMAQKGKIYVAAIDGFGYLTVDRKGNTIYQSLTHLINDTTFKLTTVWSVKLTSEFVYFQTSDAVLQYSPVAEKLTVFKTDTKGLFSRGFIYQDIYYIRLSQKGLMKIENNELKPANQSEFFKNRNNFNTAIPYNASTLLIPARTEGLYLYQPNKDTIPQIFNISNKDFITDNNIYDASTFQKEYFVLGSLKKGALLTDKNGITLQQYNEGNLLQNNKIYIITVDTSQNIWLGLSNGISKTEHSLDLSYWDKNAGLKNTVLSVIRYDGTIYLATGTKVYYINNNNQVKEVKNIPVGQNWCFLEIKNIKSLLAGTSEGIYEIKGDKAVQIYKGSNALKLYQSKKNPYRILSTDSYSFISLINKNGKWVTEGKWEGIKDIIWGITEDEKGEIWLGTGNNGVIRVTPDYNNITKPKNVRYYNKNDGFISLINILPFTFKNKIIWGTEKGLYIYNCKTDRFEPFCELGEQFCNGSRDVASLTEMPDGKIWIFPSENKKAGIGYLQPNNIGGYDWVYAPFRRIPAMSLEAFYIEPSGIAWIGGSEGVYRYDMSKDTKNYAQKFNCLIRKITAGADSLIYGGNSPNLNLQGFKNLEGLKYENNSLAFEFAAPFFDREEKTLYSYQLVGYDKEWSKWSRETKKEYTNLNEGTYTFLVKARNIYNVESETDTYQITVLPPWYRTWWAYMGYFIISIAFIWLIVKLNSRRLKAANIRLEGIVKERTLEIVQKNASLEQQKEEIQAQAEQLQSQNDKLLEMDEFKQGMTSMIVHDLKNPLNLILNIPKSITPIKQIAAMQQSGKQMLNMVLNILDVHKYEENAMKLELVEKQFALISANAVDQVKFLCQQKDIKIKDKIETGLITKVEEETIERVLVNLLTNSIKYTPVNGTITLASNRVSDDIVRIEVSDSGEGIAEDKIHLVFKKFGQIVAKKSGAVKSTGLGLTYCKMAVEAHGGEIGLNSEIENLPALPVRQAGGKAGGTTFWFTLQTGKAEHVNLKTVEKEREIEKDIITFSEDEKTILAPIIDRLKTFTIYETDDIEEILEEIKQNKAENIQKWISQIEKNIRTLNQSKYLELLKIG